MTSPLGPTPAAAARGLLDFLRRNPARHRAGAAVALALVAGATIGRACDPLRLHALEVASLITALLVLSDLFVQPEHRAESAAPRARAACKALPVSWPSGDEEPLPSCPACGLPVFAHEADAPARFSGLSWQRGSGTHLTLFPLVAGQMHANDDAAPDADGLSVSRARGFVGTTGMIASPAASQAFDADAGGAALDELAGAAADPPTSIPEMVGGDQPPAPINKGAFYAGSRLKTALDMVGASALLIGLAPLMLAIACILVASGGGPVLVHQDRLDWSGGCFRVSRFRSSVWEGSPTPGYRIIEETSQADPPLTVPFEAFLYRSGLRSLPLLVSILRGHLSFVGPDPATPKLSRRDRIGAAIVAESAARLGARPGLTGWAEVRRGGGWGRAITAREKNACDLYYLEHSSPLLDLQILARALDAMASSTAL